MPEAAAKVNLYNLSLAPSPTEQEKAVRTHTIIREHLESDPSLTKYRVDTYLQGSYKNSTNVRGDSDVDTGALTGQVFIADTSKLPTEAPSPYDKSAKVRYEEQRVPGSFGFWDYRADVLASLKGKFGAAVVDGNKAICVLGNSSRLDADVLPCLQHRLFWRFTGSDSDYSKGICFYPKDNRYKLVVNFPHQHFENLTQKNTATDGKLKGTIRIFKRIRNQLEEDGEWDRKRSPSFYLESLLWNVPNHLYGDRYDVVVRDVLRYLYTDLTEKKENGQLSTYMQANRIFYLFHPEFWNADDAIDFVVKVWTCIYG